MRTLGIVFARGASKRLPRKVLREIGGVPLIGWVARAAANAGLARALLSTEDPAIAEAARAHGLEAPFLRPPELAADFADDCDIAMHALNWAEAEEGSKYDAVVVMLSAAPFVTPAVIGAAAKALERPGIASAVVMRPVLDPPQWMFAETPDGTASLWLGEKIAGAASHKQNLPKLYIPNGMAYAVRADRLRADRQLFPEPLVCVPNDEHGRNVDVDEEIDIAIGDAAARTYGFRPFG